MTNKPECGHSITPIWRTHLRPAMIALLVGTLTLSATTRAHSQDSRTPKPPSYSVLYTFAGGADGANPSDETAGRQVIFDEEGNAYATTGNGGNFGEACGTYGCGVVFKVDPRGKETVLHAFTGPTDGRYPYGTLVRDHEGNLYGTTLFGGSTYCDGGGCGTVFKLDRMGKMTTLYSFTGGVDGGGPQAGLLRTQEGTLYGTTTFGGSYGAEYGGYGVIFRLDRTGKETVLHNFAGGSDGRNPGTSLVKDEEGNLYGTAPSGGGYGQGIIFELDRSGKETVLYTFTGLADGGNPEGIVRGPDGTLYGAAPSEFGNGVIFKLDEHGKFTVLYSFTGGTDSGVPSERRCLSGAIYLAPPSLAAIRAAVAAATAAWCSSLTPQARRPCCIALPGFPTEPIPALA